MFRVRVVFSGLESSSLARFEVTEDDECYIGLGNPPVDQTCKTSLKRDSLVR